MENNVKEFGENVNNEPMAQVENKKSVVETIKGVALNKYTLISLGAVALSYCGYQGYKFWKARKAAKNPPAEGDFEDVK